MHLSSRTPSWSYQRDWLWLWRGLGLLGLHLWRSMLIVTREIVKFRLLQHGEDAWFCNLVHTWWSAVIIHSKKSESLKIWTTRSRSIRCWPCRSSIHWPDHSPPPWWDWDYLDCIYGDPCFMSDKVTQDIVKFRPPQPYMHIIDYRAENVHRW